MTLYELYQLVETFNQKSDPSAYAAQQFGGNPADYPKLGAGGQKTAVQMPDGNVARLYHDRSKMDYGPSEGRITDLLKNDKIVPKIQFVKNKGYDIVEKVIDVYDILVKNVYKPILDQNGQPKISSKSGKPMNVSLTVQEGPNQHTEPNLTALQELVKSYWANPLFKYHMVEASPIESSAYGKNVGLVIRDGKVYAVAFDLTGLFDEKDQEDSQTESANVKFNSKTVQKLGRVAQPYGVPLNVFRGTMFAPAIHIN